MSREPSDFIPKLYKAYDFFNERLFDNELPHVMLILHRHQKEFGHFWGEIFQNSDGYKVSEISINPDYMDRHDRETLSTLVHEMCHVKQYMILGNTLPTIGHCTKWAKQMKKVGLIPSATGKPGGRQTGKSMTHYIKEGGPYDQAYVEWYSENGKLSWHSSNRLKQVILKKKTKRKKTRITKICPECNQKVSTKPDFDLVCYDCQTLLKSLGE